MSVIKLALQRPELITYFLGANNYTWLYFRNGEKKLLAKSIGYLEKELPQFVRIHKTVLVNPAYVKSLRRPPRQKMAGEVELANGEVFPVSRRRWEHIFIELETHLASGHLTLTEVENTVISNLPQVEPPKESVVQSILLITDDEQHALLAKSTIEKKWPLYQFRIDDRSTYLPELLRPLPRQSYPTLLLLDARTKTLERLHTLQRLKEDTQLGHIPVILLTVPTDQSVAEGYRQKANSVISMPDKSVSFSQTIERICRFWLHTAALPDVGRS